MTWLTFAMVAAVVAPAPARAQEADPALQAAKEEFEEGQTLYLQERYREAAAKFESAFEKKPFAAFLYNAAVCHEKARNIEQAIREFERYLALAPDAQDAADVRARIATLRAAAAPTPAAPAPAALPQIATKGLVIIDSKPPGATIYLDDKKKGAFARTPWQGSLDPRPVKLIIEAKGFKPEERQIHPRTDKIYEVYVALSEEHFLGWIEVVSNVAGAEVYLDREDSGAIGRTPYTGHVKPGKHRLWLKRPGYQVATTEIEVQPGTATTHRVEMEKVGFGWISVVGRHSKGGTLKVNGQVACSTPCQHQVEPGRHAVVVEREGMEPYRGEVTVERSQEAQVDVRFQPRPSRSRAWTSAVLSALFLGGGAYLGIEGRSLRDRLQDESGDPNGQLNTGDPRVQRGKYMFIGADVLFGLGAATALLATWGFLSSGPESTAEIEQRNIGFGPVGVPGGAGIAARGRF